MPFWTKSQTLLNWQIETKHTKANNKKKMKVKLYIIERSKVEYTPNFILNNNGSVISDEYILLLEYLVESNYFLNIF